MSYFVRPAGIEPAAFCVSCKRSATELRAPDYPVRAEGIEPSTSVLSGQRSTTELCSQILIYKPSAL